ncbi:hypothetical protein F53441_4970 [Fusarium austroafricanum]|uniref:Ankyrin repeat protein n=1 Tax=Fusarium austroafricanum TaxID=2364996 RepID=A0A8H4P045_9HYPO|nr:hypothetical protein F53441_4970 [Fusarium austroafricanum]
MVQTNSSTFSWGVANYISVCSLHILRLLISILQTQYFQLCLTPRIISWAGSACALPTDYTLGKIGAHNVVIAVLPFGVYAKDPLCQISPGRAEAQAKIREPLSVQAFRHALAVDVETTELNVNALPSTRIIVRWGEVVVSQVVPTEVRGLHLAAYFGVVAETQALLRANNPDLEDDWEQTALVYAVRNGHSAVVKLLLESGAEVDSEDAWGEMPFIIRSWGRIRYNYPASS